jgi:hypothetical protein
MFDERFVYAQELTLSHRLRLLRQPDNEHDPNAVQVIHPQMGQIGFLPRQMAALFASHIDLQQDELTARIVELQQEPATQQVRVRIEFDVPADWLALAPTPSNGQPSPILYHVQSSTSSTHLLLNCTAEQLLNVRDLLSANGIEVTRSGYSTWPAANGFQYEWYVRMPVLHDVEAARMTQLLERRLAAVSDEQHRNRLDELTRRYQWEVAVLSEKLRNAEREKRDAWKLGADAEAEKQRDIERLLAELAHVQAEQDNLKRQSYELRLEKESLSQSLLSRDAGKAPFGIEVEHAFLDVAADTLSPRQALEVIQHLFADRVVVLPTALKSAEDSSNFRHRSALFRLLWKLVKEYWPRLVSGQGDTDARAIFGDDFAAQESEVTANNRHARQKREFDYNGQSLLMLKHLRIGVKESPTETIRVHFAWVSEERKIVIGHCGPHLPLR